MYSIHDFRKPNTLFQATLLLLLCVGQGFARDPLDAVAGQYSGFVTLGDSRAGAPIPKRFLLAVDLGITVTRTGQQWSGELSLKRFVTTSPPPGCAALPGGETRELKAPFQNITVQPNGTFEIQSSQIQLCYRGRAIVRSIHLTGRIATRNNCEHVELRGHTYGNYRESLRGYLQQLDTRSIDGTFSLIKVKDPEGYQVPAQPETCADLDREL